jgi:hypothetical protein
MSDEKLSSSPPSFPIAITTNRAGAPLSVRGGPSSPVRAASQNATATSRQTSANAESSRATSSVVPQPSSRAPSRRIS